jgi:hypothetical protein
VAKLSGFLGGLSLGGLAIPGLTDRQRQFVLQYQHDLSLAEIAGHLRGDTLPLVDDVFNTKMRRGQLKAAYRTFVADVVAWKQLDRWSAQFTWLVPPEMAAEVVAGRQDELTSFLEVIWTLSATPPRYLRPEMSEVTIRRLRSIRGLRLATCREALAWMPYLSIEAARTIGSLRGGDISHLIVPFAIGVDRLGLSSNLRPWSAKLPGRVRALPLGWLYQFVPSRRLEQLVLRLSSAGCRNLGHLAVLHPELTPKLTAKYIPAWIGLQMIIDLLYSAEQLRRLVAPVDKGAG